MKRKTTILLSSVLMLIGLVSCNPNFSDSTVSPEGGSTPGSTSDNSQSTSESSAPGESEIDSEEEADSGDDDSSEGEQDTPVTLSWGEETELNDINGLVPGVDIKAGAVKLVSSVAYEGSFTISLTDETTASKGTTDAYLVDYLNIRVYQGNISTPGSTPVMQITTDTTRIEKTKSAAINVTSNSNGVVYSIFVSMDDMISHVYDQITNDVVSIEVNWNQA